MKVNSNYDHSLCLSMSTLISRCNIFTCYRQLLFTSITVYFSGHIDLVNDWNHFRYQPKSLMKSGPCNLLNASASSANRIFIRKWPVCTLCWVKHRLFIYIGYRSPEDNRVDKLSMTYEWTALYIQCNTEYLNIGNKIFLIDYI